MKMAEMMASDWQAECECGVYVTGPCAMIGWGCIYFVCRVVVEKIQGWDWSRHAFLFGTLIT